MTSIRTQAHGVQAFKLTQTQLGISLTLSKVWHAQNRCYKRKRRSVMTYQQQRMTSIRTQAHGVLAFKLTRTLIGVSPCLSKVWQAQKRCYKRKRRSVMTYQQQRMTSIRTQAHGVLAFKLTWTLIGISLSLLCKASTKIMLQKEDTKRCDMSTTTNDFNSHASKRCTRIQVD